MLALLIFSLVLVGVLADVRNFAPQAPDMEFHKQRIWLWLNPKCFEQEINVLQFKDYLLSKYECINYDNNRKKIHKHPITMNDSVWSLWLELNQPNLNNFDCLNDNITLPSNIINECIHSVYFEPLQKISQISSCSVQPASGQLWSVDVMDGVQDTLYRYLSFQSTPAAVEAIVLDTDVDNAHVEFSGLKVVNLFSGNLNPGTSQAHGTHVSGTVVGSLVGVSKGTALNYYPVCQLGSSCAWNHIEDGYETAIALMQSNPNVRYVINYSVGGSRTATNEVAYNAWGLRIQNSGNYWVTSAGNSASNACNFAPAFSSYAITIGAYTEGYVPTTRFTNYGTCVDTWAPGEYVWSATPGDGYGYSSGTSMASPNICGLVINLLKENPNRSLQSILTYLANNARPLINVPSHFGTATAAYWNTGCSQ